MCVCVHVCCDRWWWYTHEMRCVSVRNCNAAARGRFVLFCFCVNFAFTWHTLAHFHDEKCGLTAVDTYISNARIVFFYYSYCFYHIHSETQLLSTQRCHIFSDRYQLQIIIITAAVVAAAAAVANTARRHHSTTTTTTTTKPSLPPLRFLQLPLPPALCQAKKRKYATIGNS